MHAIQGGGRGGGFHSLRIGIGSALLGSNSLLNVYMIYMVVLHKILHSQKVYKGNIYKYIS